MILLINRTLDDRYTLLEMVGGGGMAEVYRAHDQLLDRFVAVKILRSQFATNEQFVTRFRRESQAAAKLSHPNIVNVYDVGQDGEIYYIVMEYISGETLKDKIDRDGVLPVETAIKIADEIAQGLEHAHQNHLVHCDIKPHNILVTKAGRIKVTDFGIARAVTSATMVHTGTIIGSVHYFSPEQAKGEPVSAQSDIYSLGVVLYEMLTGKVPFDGDSPISIAIKHIQEDIIPPCQINPEIPPLVEAIVLKAMAKEPQDRFNTISEMINDLRLAQGYLRDDSTRKISREEYPTQLLTGMNEALRDSGHDSTRILNNGENLSTKRRKKAWVIALLFFLLLGFATGAFLAFGKFWSGAEVTVPDVTGKQVEQAKNLLTSHNLRVSVSEVFNDKVVPGQVISQTPEAGSIVKEQRTINLIVSRGGEVAAVPDLRGLNRKDAEIALKNAGLLLGKVDEQATSDVPPDSVLSQYPRPPAQVSKGTAVDIVISKAVIKKLILPDFRGALLSSVTSQLDSLKIKLGNVTDATSEKYPPGTIIEQKPAPNSELTEGAAIDFTVVKAAVSAPKKATVAITVPDGPMRQAVQIVVSDSNGRRVVYENVHKPGDKIDKQVEGTGTVRVQIYINGGLLQEQTL